MYEGDDTLPSNTITYQYDLQGKLKKKKTPTDVSVKKSKCKIRRYYKLNRIIRKDKKE
jgi:YD repeat-containing protein